MTENTVSTEMNPLPETDSAKRVSPRGTARARLKQALLLPLRLAKRHAVLLRGFAYDYLQFAKWSSTVYRGDNQEKLRALITMDYHGVEKGLSLSSPRARFGMPVIKRLLLNIRSYIGQYCHDDTTRCALDTLSAYCKFHVNRGDKLDWLEREVAALRPPIEDLTDSGGTVYLRRADILAASSIDLPRFSDMRFSVRQYTDQPVDGGSIHAAVRIAQKTPSVCNRQSWRVHAVQEKSLAQEVLTYHGGARGFSEDLSTVLIISTERGAFQSSGERYQCWIDGGMFAMSLVNALHHLGLGTCCLNWSKDPAVDRGLRALVPIPPSEAVIMLLAVGHIPDHLQVARSERRPMLNIVTSY